MSVRVFEPAKAKYKLQIVATPIGNLSELSARAKLALQEADVIFCEDTRVTHKLLSLVNITKPKLIPNHGHNQKQRLEEILVNIKDNKKVVLVSDAGYPVISDPGAIAVEYLYNQDVAVEVINGPSAPIHALVASGLDIATFLFIGFLPSRAQERIVFLNKHLNSGYDLVFFEAPHRINETLNDLNNFNPELLISVCRELTKMNETIYRGKVSQLIHLVESRGEIVVVVKTSTHLDSERIELSQAQLISKITEFIVKNPSIRPKDVCNILASELNLKSSFLYQLYLTTKK